MRFNNIEKSCSISNQENTDRSSTTTSMLEAIDASVKKSQIRNNCKQMAQGILIRLNIHQETKELTTFIGDCNAINNLDAVTEWVFRLSPDQNSVTRIDIDGFAMQLRMFIEDYLEW